MDHFRENGYHTLGTGKIMHNGERKERFQGMALRRKLSADGLRFFAG